MTEHGLRFFDLSFLRDRTAQRLVLAATAILAFLGGVLGWVSPKWYKSVVTVVPARSLLRGSPTRGEVPGRDIGAFGRSVWTRRQPGSWASRALETVHET